ncbi:Protein bric-a-brac 2 [Armadillidium vulgare]|nr:Protein bric-a-brac 2 [Armadillidium vulgare]
MGDGNLLSLRWNNHISNFKFTLGQLQQKDLFSDATIACDGQFYPVHKFVLSTCSDYFANMFERTPCKHPIIVLKDISSKDIELLLSYMYGGEVRVSQIDLPSLIKAAETLQIKGLFAPDDPPGSPTGSKSHVIDSEEETSESRNKKRKIDNCPSGKKYSDNTVKEEVEEKVVVDNEEVGDNDTLEENEPLHNSQDSDKLESNLVEKIFYEENSNFSKLGMKRGNDDIALADSSSSRDSSNLEASSIPPPPTVMVVSQDSDCVPWPSSLVSCSTTTNSNTLNSSNNSQQNPLYSRPSMISCGKIKLGELKPNVEESEPNHTAISFIEPSISLSEENAFAVAK